MTVNFFSFSKRRNSVITPSSTGGEEFQCVLKSDCSILTPRLEMRGDETQLTGKNYIYIENFSRYYWIDDISWNAGVWTINASVDPLASWSAYIKNTSAQVLFSSSNYKLDVIDNRIAAMGGYTRNTGSAGFSGALSGQQTGPDGYFALTALDNTGSWATGAATTYFLTYQQMQDFARDLLTSGFWEEVKQFFSNPMDAIVECYYIPLDISQYISLSASRDIVVGNYTFPTAQGKSALATNMSVKNKHTTIDIPWVYSDFRNLSPYTSIEIFMPFCGSSAITPEDCYNAEYLLIDYSVDVMSGSVQAVVYLKDTILQEFSGNCRVNIPIGQTQSRVDSILGAAGGAVTAGAGIISGNVALGASGILSAIGSAVSPTHQKILGGTGGSVLGAILGNDTMRWQNIRISVTSHETNAQPSTIRSVIGNVNGDVLNISGLSGYCQTYGFSVQCPATKTEIDQINSMMDGGVYL